MEKVIWIVVFGIIALADAAVNKEEFLTLTLSQKLALDKLRAKVQPLLKTEHMKQDIFLVRWLRTGDYDANSAEKLLRNSLKWRQENKIDTILSEDWSDMIQEFHATTDTHDKTGQPIGVFDINDWDIRRGILQGKGQRLLRYVVSIMENLIGQIIEKQEKGMNVTHMTILMNADGANVVQQACGICLPLWIQFVQLVETYYPRYLDEFIIIDAPPAVNVVFESVRPFFSRNNRDVFQIFGQNKNQWMGYLDKRISRDQRRPMYGGTKAPPNY